MPPAVPLGLRRGAGSGVGCCGDEGAGPAGGDGAVAGEPGRLRVGLEEGAVGDDELDLDPADPAGGAGDAFDQGIGHGLAAAPRVPGVPEALGVPGQRGVHGHALADREQGAQVAHGVRGRAEADVPVGGGVRGPGRDGPRVQPVGGSPGLGGDGPVPGAVERAGVGGEVLVDGGAVRGGQAGGLAHQQRGAPFVQLPALQRGEGVRHFGHERLGQAQQPAAPGRGFAPGQGDLRPDAGAELLRRDPGGGLGAALEQIEGHREAGLFGGQRGFPVLQLPDPVNDPGTVRRHRTGGAGQGSRQGSGSGEGPAATGSCYRYGSRIRPLLAVHE